jgi:hypothetical protein
MVEEIIREMYRKTLGRMKAELRGMGGEEPDAESKLPSFEAVKDIRLSMPKGSGSYETKALLDCALWELDIVDQDYGARADTMLQHQRFVRALKSRPHPRRPSSISRTAPRS